MTSAQNAASPQVFDWDISAGPCGASVDQHRAVRAMHDALLDAPLGAEGTVREVALTTYGSYQPVREIGRAVHDSATGCIVWWEGGHE